jgi:hypothetical protein
MTDTHTTTHTPRQRRLLTRRADTTMLPSARSRSAGDATTWTTISDTTKEWCRVSVCGVSREPRYQ